MVMNSTGKLVLGGTVASGAIPGQTISVEVCRFSTLKIGLNDPDVRYITRPNASKTSPNAVHMPADFYGKSATYGCCVALNPGTTVLGYFRDINDFGLCGMYYFLKDKWGKILSMLHPRGPNYYIHYMIPTGTIFHQGTTTQSTYPAPWGSGGITSLGIFLNNSGNAIWKIAQAYNFGPNPDDYGVFLFKEDLGDASNVYAGGSIAGVIWSVTGTILGDPCGCENLGAAGFSTVCVTWHPNRTSGIGSLSLPASSFQTNSTLVFKINSVGSVSWTTRITPVATSGYRGTAFTSGVCTDTAGNSFVLMTVQVTGNTNTQMMLSKLSPSGLALITRKIEKFGSVTGLAEDNNIQSIGPSAIIYDSYSGHIFGVACVPSRFQVEVFSFDTVSLNARWIKSINPLGATWTANLQTIGYSRSPQIFSDGVGGIYVIATSYASQYSTLVKFNTNGVLQWARAIVSSAFVDANDEVTTAIFHNGQADSTRMYLAGTWEVVNATDGTNVRNGIFTLVLPNDGFGTDSHNYGTIPVSLDGSLVDSLTLSYTTPQLSIIDATASTIVALEGNSYVSYSYPGHSFTSYTSSIASYFPSYVQSPFTRFENWMPAGTRDETLRSDGL